MFRCAQCGDEVMLSSTHRRGFGIAEGHRYFCCATCKEEFYGHRTYFHNVWLLVVAAMLCWFVIFVAIRAWGAEPYEGAGVLCWTKAEGVATYNAMLAERMTKEVHGYFMSGQCEVATAQVMKVTLIATHGQLSLWSAKNKYNRGHTAFLIVRAFVS